MPSRSRILQACYLFLIPVARLLLRTGITYKEFAEISRLAFVEVASKDYGIRGRPTNISRVSAMTGIGRKEISRLRRIEANYDKDLQSHLRTHFNPLGDVLHCWFTDEKYLMDGKPKPLPLRGPCSFEELVRQCAGDLPPGALKVELIRSGAIAELSNGNVVAKRRVLIPKEVDEKIVTYLATRLRGLALTAVHNCTAKNAEEPWLEREVYSTHLPKRVLERLRPVIKERVSDCVSELDDLISEHETHDSECSNRVGVGFFYYEDPA